MKKESWKTVAIVVLAMACSLAAVLAIDLRMRLNIAMHDLTVKTERFDALEKSVNLKPAPVVITEAAPCPVCARPKPRAIKKPPPEQPPITPAYVLELARACDEGRWQHFSLMTKE